jgi:hypothetical protein
MKVARIAVLAALTSVLAIAVVGTANAVSAGRWDSQVLGNVLIDPEDPTVAYVTARYTCPTGGVPHLWVSVKQAESRGPDPLLKEEGSSGYAAAWSQSHPTAQVVCDGTWHVDTFTVDQTETPPWSPNQPIGFGQLTAGQAYAQFCLLDASSEEGPIAFSMRFAGIR